MRKSSSLSSSLLPKLGSTERLQVKNLFVFLAALLVAVCLVPSFALAGTAHEYEKSFGPGGPGTSEFEGPGAVAVDQGTHDVYVADLVPGTIGKFDENGNPLEFSPGVKAIGGFSFVPEFGTSEIAVNSGTHDFYVADFGNHAIRAFHEDGEPADFSALSSNEIPGIEVCGVAVDANGDIYMGEALSGIHVFAPSGEELTAFPATEPCNVAVDSHGAVYVNGFFETHPGVEKFLPSTFPVTTGTTYALDTSIGESSPGAHDGKGVVDPSPIFALAVDPVSDELYVDRRLAFEESQIAQYNEHGQSAGTFPEPGKPGALKRSEGVAVDGSTGNVYVSDAKGEHQVEIFIKPPPVPPVIESSSATDVTATSADLQARIDPEQFDTHYHFEYLTEAEYQANKETFVGAHSTPEIDLGASVQPQTAHGHAGGLQPDTPYRFRVIATSEGGTVNSPEPAPHFATFPANTPVLPDGRAYEMVSPAQKSGEVFAPNPIYGGTCEDCLPGYTSPFMPMQSAPDGEAVLYMGNPFSDGFASSPNEYVSRRGPGGWETQSLSSSVMEEGAYQAFSPDLSRSVLFQQTPALSGETPTQKGESFADLYLRGEGGLLQPLVAVEPPNRNTEKLVEGGGNGFGVVYSGANSGTSTVPAFGHVLFEANDALTKEVKGVAPVAPTIAVSEKNLYEWAEGELRLVNVLPGNETAAAGAVIGAGRLLVVPGDGREGVDVDHAISADGRRIFWSEEGTGQVYVRIDGKETLEVPGPGRCKKSLPLAERVCFLTASADGSQVLLSDGEVYELNEKAGAYEPAMDLTQGQGGFQGILGASKDLSSVYFVDTAALTGGAVAGKLNLYASHEGIISFVSALLETDNEIDLYGDWRPSPSSRTAQVSSDGRYLAFMSRAPLTGYDNEHSGGGGCQQTGTIISACTEVFEYEAVSKSLACASCNPSGQRPLGPSSLSVMRGAPLFLPSPQLANLSPEGGGRLFFESQDVLSPHDTNGHIQDVYEWEPDGIGSCKRAGGCVSLISSGHSPNDSMFLSASVSGNDAFIVTREQLLPEDKNEQLDLYDARVGGGIAVAETPPCGGEACKGSLASSPPSQSPGSSVFSGPGNFALSVTPKPDVKPRQLTRAQKLAGALKACAKKPKRIRRSCRAQARKRYDPIMKAKAKTKSNKGSK